MLEALESRHICIDLVSLTATNSNTIPLSTMSKIPVFHHWTRSGRQRETHTTISINHHLRQSPIRRVLRAKERVHLGLHLSLCRVQGKRTYLVLRVLRVLVSLQMNLGMSLHRRLMEVIKTLDVCAQIALRHRIGVHQILTRALEVCLPLSLSLLRLVTMISDNYVLRRILSVCLLAGLCLSLSLNLFISCCPGVGQ
jgi:hypothetical protein